MSELTKAVLPRVSRELALDLDRRFRPMTLQAGIKRDALMISIGERRVVDYILHHSQQHTITSDPEELRESIEARKPSLWQTFTSRFGGS